MQKLKMRKGAEKNKKRLRTRLDFKDLSVNSKMNKDNVKRSKEESFRKIRHTESRKKEKDKKWKNK